MSRPTWSGLARIVVAAALAIASLPLAAPARADDDSYLAKLRAADVVIPLTSGALVQRGHMICTFLHRGVRPEDAPSRYWPSVGMPQMMAAAQSELCPDTLG